MNNQQLIVDFCNNLLTSQAKSINTVNSYHYDLKKFVIWLEDRSLLSYSFHDIEDYLEFRYQQGISEASNLRFISCLKNFHSYLNEMDYRHDNPLAKLNLPKLPQSLPKTLSRSEIKKLLKAPDLTSDIGIRDRVMLELMYASGLRVSELVNLKFGELDLEEKQLLIKGKGDKPRIAIFAESTRNWLAYYIKEIRSKANNNTNAVFISRQGGVLTRQSFWHRIKIYATWAKLDLDLISPHVLRHAFATHMVDSGADLRVVQQLLGHTNISTTQIYVHLANKYIKEMHLKHHPRNKVKAVKKPKKQD